MAVSTQCTATITADATSVPLIEVWPVIPRLNRLPRMKPKITSIDVVRLISRLFPIRTMISPPK